MLLTTYDGMDSAMVSFILLEIFFMNSLILSLSNSLTSKIIDMRRSFIVSNPSSFHSNLDFLESKSSVMSSWVSEIAILFGALSLSSIISKEE